MNKNKIVKTIGVSPITNTIYWGRMNEEKQMWVGEKTDVTEDAVSAVFQWFYNQMEGKEEFSISYPSLPGIKLKMVRELEEETGWKN